MGGTTVLSRSAGTGLASNAFHIAVYIAQVFTVTCLKTSVSQHSGFLTGKSMARQHILFFRSFSLVPADEYEEESSQEVGVIQGLLSGCLPHP